MQFFSYGKSESNFQKTATDNPIRGQSINKRRNFLWEFPSESRYVIILTMVESCEVWKCESTRSRMSV